MTQNRVFKLADIRNLNKQVALGQISSMRMVEILNAMAYEWHSYKLQAHIDKEREKKENLENTCIIPKCKRVQHRIGWCKVHYNLVIRKQD